MASHNRPKIDEEICRKHFDGWLAVRQPELKRVWGTPATDSPDYTLLLGAQNYAVEVTLLYDKFPNQGRKLEPLDVGNAVTKFGENVERQAKAQQILQGLYLIFFKKAPHSYGDKKANLNLQQKAVDFIAQTQNSQLYAETVLEPDYLSIEKVSNVGQSVQALGPGHPLAAAYKNQQISFEDLMTTEGKDVCAEVARLLNEHWASLQRVGVTDPVIFLLGIGYSIAVPGILRACVNSLPVMQHLHTIYLVESETYGEILCSKEVLWV